MLIQSSILCRQIYLTDRNVERVGNVGMAASGPVTSSRSLQYNDKRQDDGIVKKLKGLEMLKGLHG